MKTTKNTKGYLFVVDTDSYSGNFERDMCAYITGQIGDCEVGEDYIQEDFNYDGFGDLVDGGYFNDGCARPCEIWRSLGYFNDGMGGVYKPGEEKETFDRYKAKGGEGCSDYIKKMIDETTFEDFCKRKHPLYQSVAIAFYERPSDELINLMKDRGNSFPDIRYKNYNKHYGFVGERIKIEGFRLIEVVEEEIEEVV